MSSTIRLETDEEIFSVEVGENVLDGWEIIGEGNVEGLVDLAGEAKRCEGRTHKHVANGEGRVETAMFA